MEKRKTLFWLNSVFALLIIVVDILFITLGRAYIFKSLASILFVVLGVINMHFAFSFKERNPHFKFVMLTGLVFACLGDILLIDFFLVGAVLFAVGHIFFFVAYALLNRINWRDIALSLIIFDLSLLLILLAPIFDFQGMLPVVIVYAFIIAFMLGKSISNLFEKEYRDKNLLIMLGSLMFFLSDLMLLFNVFADVSRVFDILCLVLYYPAEILLAISISYSGRDDKEMGVFRKIFCRIFQQCFHILIPLLPYRQPKILKNMDEVILALKEEKITKILLVTDKSIRGLGLTKELEEKLKSAEISVFVFDDILPNPTTKMVEAGLEIYLKNHCEGAIAFGGGSVMDTAKVILARSRYPKKSIAKMRGLLKITKKLPPLFAVPTTAGTGSETTLAAVITDAENRDKYAINSFPLIPKYAVLDFKTTLDLPKNVTATTGMDALTHAVEAYIGKSTTRLTRRMAEEATKLIAENLVTAYDQPHNAVARQNMLKASYFAGVSFTISYVGYVHAIAHSLGGQYGTAHGFANAVVLPFVLKSYGKSAEKKLARLAVTIGVAKREEDRHTASQKFIAFIEGLNKHFGLPNFIADLKAEDIETLARHADKEANPLYPVPKLLGATELADIYTQLLSQR